MSVTTTKTTQAMRVPSSDHVYVACIRPVGG